MHTARSNRGLTLTEVLVVMGILAIIALVVAPNVISWRNKVRLRSAADNLKGDLQTAKASAARENCWIVIEFFNDSYQLFVDNGEGGGARNDGKRNGTERVMRTRSLPAGVNIESGGLAKTHFNSRGRAANGQVVLANSRGDRKKLIISVMGRIRMEDG